MRYDPTPSSGSHPEPIRVGFSGTGPPFRSRNGVRLGWALALVSAGAISAAACASPGSGDFNAGAGPEAVSLHVVNRNFSDVRVYLVGGTVPARLGVVGGHESRTFRVPPGRLRGGGELRLAGELIASRQTFSSVPLVVHAGDRVEWRIEANPKLSTLQIRQR